mmetsp:Transcript_15494/g.38705  ORF Transcript_15494/g.38705 Transcript_15494/m.38705 type:complete len:521 (-) Transcript_15494:40-1602(-)
MMPHVLYRRKRQQQQQQQQPPQRRRRATIHCVTQTVDLIGRLPILSPECWVTRYVGLPDLCDKGNFARLARSCQDLCEPGEWDFIPDTWVLPEQAEAVRSLFGSKSGTFIVKPEDGSHGNGIFLVQGLRELDIKMSTRREKTAVVQRYIDKPLLLGGMKFDLRLYVCLAGGSSQRPPRVFVCREGLARFCTQAYEEPNSRNMHRSMAHLTNYSLNKRSEHFEHGGETIEAVFDPQSSASKRPLTAVLKQIEAEFPEFDRRGFYDRIAELARTTTAALAPVLVSYFRGVGGDGPMPCMHLLGFDVMLDRNFKLHLLELNNSPSLCVEEALALEIGDPRLEGRVARLFGRSREKDGKVCYCTDLEQPHLHRTALVDFVVKATVVGGAFRLLDQLARGVEWPQVKEFISVDVANHRLYFLLQSAERLFARSGGAQKAFTSLALRRTFEPLCQVSNARLEKHDLDAISVRCRGSSYVSQDRGVKPEPLRLFDFLDVLRRVGARAFPGESPAGAIERALAAVEPG